MKICRIPLSMLFIIACMTLSVSLISSSGPVNAQEAREGNFQDQAEQSSDSDKPDANQPDATEDAPEVAEEAPEAAEVVPEGPSESESTDPETTEPETTESETTEPETTEPETTEPETTESELADDDSNATVRDADNELDGQTDGESKAEVVGQKDKEADEEEGDEDSSLWKSSSIIVAGDEADGAESGEIRFDFARSQVARCSSLVCGSSPDESQLA